MPDHTHGVGIAMTGFGLVALLVALAAASALGFWLSGSGRRLANPRPAAVDVPRLGRDDLGADLGERATLVQFSSAFCQPCRATRRILSDVSRDVAGVAHVEIDAEQHLDVVRRLGITRTPTTLVLDPAGLEVTRAVGAPTRDQEARTVSAIG